MNIKTITIHLLLSYLLFSTIFLSCSTKHKVLYEEPKNPKEKPEDLSVNENGEKLYDVFQGGIFVRETLDSPAKLIGDDEFYRKAFRNIRYPAKAKQNGTKGAVFISYEVNELGSTKNFKIKKGIGSGCDEETLRVIKVAYQNAKYIPAIKNGETVKVKLQTSINFRLE